MTIAPPPPSSDWAFFFDIDGTLSELVATPDRARIAPELLERIGALVRQTGGAVAVVSGRTLHDIDAIFRGMRIPAAGQHGAEWRDTAGHITRLERPASLGAERDALAGIVSRHTGLMLEDKGLSFALHYRAAPQLAAFAHRLVRAAQRRLGPDYIVQAGKRLVELVPDATNKGIAIESFMKQSPFRGRTPVFLGDDVTDEHAFTAVDALGGHSIKVGPGRSAARWRLASVDAVSSWIGQPVSANVAATDSSTWVDA
jgi:trehalose 6-phosphate phosphatase